MIDSLSEWRRQTGGARTSAKLILDAGSIIMVLMVKQMVGSQVGLTFQPFMYDY
jgi:hypothetical protein